MTDGISEPGPDLRHDPGAFERTDDDPQELPDLDDLASICLLADLSGVVRWASAPTEMLIERGSAGNGSGAVMDLVHPLDHDQFRLLFRRIRLHQVRVEMLVRLREAPHQGANNPERYAQLMLSPWPSGPTAAADGRILVQGWDVSRLVRRMRELEIHASRDPLTGLANRTTFMDRLRHELALSIRSGNDVAVLFADVDGLKKVNDTYGHEAGDAVLTGIAERMTASLRPADTLARIGGDEFAIVCPDLADPGQAMAVADRLRSAAARPVAIPGRRISVTLSIGIAFASGTGGEDSAATMLRRADLAMYELKRADAVASHFAGRGRERKSGR